MKTLLNIQYTPEAQQQFIDWANTICGYPDKTGTMIYANTSEPVITYNEDGSIKEQRWITKVTHDLQEKAIAANDNTYSFVAGEILEDGTIVVTDTVIEATNAEQLIENARNYVIDLTPSSATQEVIDKLVENNNTIIYESI